MTDLSALTDAISLSTLTHALLSIGAALAALYIAIKAVKVVLSMLKEEKVQYDPDGFDSESD